jgi:hypothetical protein
MQEYPGFAAKYTACGLVMKPSSTSVGFWTSRTHGSGALKIHTELLWCHFSLQNVPCGAQGLTGLILLEGTIRNQQYLQQLHKIIPVIQEAGHVDTFFQQVNVCPHIANAILDILHEVFGSYVLSKQFQECFRCGWSWQPCSTDMNSCNHFLWGIPQRLCSTPTHTLFRICKLFLIKSQQHLTWYCG